MIVRLLLFLPSSVCLFWSFLFAVKQKNRSQRLLLIQLLLAMVGLLFPYCIFSPTPDYGSIAVMQCVSHPFLLYALACSILYLHSHKRALPMSAWKTLFFVPAFVQLALSVITLVLIGIDGASEVISTQMSGLAVGSPGYSQVHTAYYFVNVILASSFEGLMIILVLVYSLRYYRRHNSQKNCFRDFLFKGGEATLPRVICLFVFAITLFVIPSLPCLQFKAYHNPVLFYISSTVLAIALHLLCYIEYVGHSTRLTLHNLLHLDIQKNELQPEIEELKTDYTERKKEEVFLEQDEKKQDQLSHKLHVAFEEQRVYVAPDLTLVGLAAQLGTNRSTLSALVNLTYGLTFRDLLSLYRIEAAKKYLLSHPDATQEVIAGECGFHTAQALNHKFKEVVGMSPRVWLLSQSHAE